MEKEKQERLTREPEPLILAFKNATGDWLSMEMAGESGEDIVRNFCIVMLWLTFAPKTIGDLFFEVAEVIEGEFKQGRDLK